MLLMLLVNPALCTRRANQSTAVPTTPLNPNFDKWKLKQDFSIVLYTGQTNWSQALLTVGSSSTIRLSPVLFYATERAKLPPLLLFGNVTTKKNELKKNKHQNFAVKLPPPPPRGSTNFCIPGYFCFLLPLPLMAKQGRGRLICPVICIQSRIYLQLLLGLFVFLELLLEDDLMFRVCTPTQCLQCVWEVSNQNCWPSITLFFFCLGYASS